MSSDSIAKSTITSDRTLQAQEPPVLRDTTLDEQQWYQRYKHDFCFGQDDHELLKRKPIPVRWARYYVDSIQFDEESGKKWALRWVDEAFNIMGGSEGLTALQELILDGDINTAMYQIRKTMNYEEIEDSGSETASSNGDEYETRPAEAPMLQREVSILHYAALTSQVDNCRRLLEDTPFIAQIHQKDVVTGFSPLHIAVFVQNRALMYLFLTHGADIDFKDNYGATVVDYLRYWGKIPYFRPIANPATFYLATSADNSTDGTVFVKSLDIEEFVQATSLWKSNNDPAAVEPSHAKFQWTTHYRINESYIEELMFGGYEAPSVKDKEFRDELLAKVEKPDLGASNLIIALVNDQVGWGCYAARDFDEGDFIAAYLGEYVAKKNQKDRSYAMASSLDGVVLDASKYRNIAAFINHSPQANAEAQGVFERGIDHIAIVATRHIPKGQQICLNYGADYFRASSKKTDQKRVAPSPEGFQDMLANVETAQMPSTLAPQILEAYASVVASAKVRAKARS